MKNRVGAFLSFIFIFWTTSVFSQDNSQQQLQKGANFIETKVYSEHDNARILKLYQGLRVADVSDGMDMVELPGTGLVDPAIHPAWIDEKDLSHQFRGIAQLLHDTSRPKGRTVLRRGNSFVIGKGIFIMRTLRKPLLL